MDVQPHLEAGSTWGARPGELLLPCGSCIGCRTSRAREWALRNWLEFQDHQHGAFVTLTYNDENLPPTLSKPHLQGYLKRLRSRREGTRVRFFASGEYGDQRKRPHYHALVYGLHQDDPALADAWNKGHVYSVEITPARIAYTAGYVAKKVGWREECGPLIDYSTGEYLGEYQPPFITMSKNPGIGAEWRKHTNAWRDQAIYHASPIPVPRYLHQAWLDNATDDEKLKLQEEKQLKVRAVTLQQLRAQELISSAQQHQQTQRRKLND